MKRSSYLLSSLLAAGLLLGGTGLSAAPAPQAGTAPAAPTASPLDKPVFDAIEKYKAGDAPGALAILEPHKGELTGQRPLLALLGALYLDSGKPQPALEILAPLAAAADADAPVLYNTGRAELALGKIAEARRDLARSVAIEPASPASRELGLLFAREGQIVEAYRSLRPWSIRSPRDSEARLTAAMLALQLERPFEAEELLIGQKADDPAIRLLSAKVAIQKGDGPAALALLQPIAAKHPPAMDLEIRRTQAEAYLLADSPAEALALLRGKSGNVPALALLLARAQRQTKDAAGALATLKPFADKLPTDPAAAGDPRPAAAIAVEYGQLLAAQGKAPEGLVFLERATKLNPVSPEAFRAYGDALTAAHRAEEARAPLAKAQELAAGRAKARAEAEKAAQEFRAAVTETTTAPPKPAVPASPEMQEAMRKMATGDQAGAIAAIHKRVVAVPGDVVARALEVRLLLSSKRYTEALAAADAALRQAPQNPDMIYQHGAVQMALGHVGDAELDFRRAIAIDAKNVAAMSDLAVLLSVQNKKPEAEQLLRRVLEINPRDVNAKQTLDALYEK
ncbi:MAG TPA: tetratricopeptide repeat protein [Thermoanaerobaculia bacterium]|nr:tetratricopeptide repeat protein [Thermoanaerobaculia bacterium]